MENIIRSVSAGRFQDFLNSKYCSEDLEKLSSAPVRNHQKFYKEYAKLECLTGETLYVVFSGRTGLVKYIKNFVNLEDLFERQEYVRVIFDEFSVYAVVLLNSKCKPMPILLMNRRLVWCPRKSPCTTYPVPTPMTVIDNYSNSLYILPDLRYPDKEEDRLKLIRWLRLKKQALYVRYMAKDYNINHWCYYPRFADRWVRWQKQATILIGDDTFFIGVSMDSLCSVIDYKKREVVQFTAGIESIKVKEPLNITQDMIDEFVYWQNNRYKITK